MKATALIAAAALVCGTTAFAQQHDSTGKTTRGEENVSAEQQNHGSAGEKMREGMHNLGEKTRNALHRMEDKLHAKRDHADNTHAMGASRSTTTADASSSRQKRMDDAYANYRSKQDRTENR